MRISDWSSDVCSSDLEPGEMATLKLLRDGKKLTVKVDVGTLAPGVAQDDLEPPKPAPIGPLGLAVRSMNADERSKAQVLSGGVTVISVGRSEEHTSELQSLMRISYAVFCLKKKNKIHQINTLRSISAELNLVKHSKEKTDKTRAP